jgi:hypothetical protein
VNTFELEMDGGLIPQKGRGSLAKEMAELVSSVSGPWISIPRLTTKKVMI